MIYGSRAENNREKITSRITPVHCKYVTTDDTDAQTNSVENLKINPNTGSTRLKKKPKETGLQNDSRMFRDRGREACTGI